ncbi:MAG: hypothetical protein J0M11_08035 [Anaerolineae bacterium]|nr:hypothetical protein [Anaerolineae bacterium]
MAADSTNLVFSLFCCLGGMLLGVIPFVVMAVKIIPKNKRLSVYRLGQYIGERGPGLVLLIPIVDRGTLIDSQVE